MKVMTSVEGVSMIVAAIAMVYFARPRQGGYTTWVMRFPFFGELYAVLAISLFAMGLCITASS